MLEFELSAQVRSKFGKSASRSLRRAGMTPAILYSSKTEPVALQLNAKELTKTLLKTQRRNAFFNVEIDDNGGAGKRHVIVKEIQTDPISDSLVHADFYEISLEEPLLFNVPIKYVGNSKGVELGGDLHVTLTEIPVKGLIKDIPDFFEIDIAGLGIGEEITCSSLKVASTVELLNNIDDICVSVRTAKREASKTEEAEETAE